MHLLLLILSLFDRLAQFVLPVLAHHTLLDTYLWLCPLLRRTSTYVLVRHCHEWIVLSFFVILVDHESASIMRMMRMADQEHKTGGVQAFTPLQKMEINPSHPIITALNDTRNSDPKLAKIVAICCC